MAGSLLHTREVRWFLKTPEPTIAAWFAQLPKERVTVERRTDVYWPAGNAQVGIKWRQGRLEVKTQTKAPEPYLLQNQWVGRLESWVKQRFDLADPSADSASNFPGIRVEKQRHAVVLSGPDGRVSPIGPSAAEGCQVEQTFLRIGSDTWYTMGLEWPLEYFEALPESFLKVVLNRAALVPDQSMGYPQFLGDQYPARWRHP